VMMNIHATFAALLGGWEMVLILAVILILFGAKKLPELARGLGSGIKEFKKATRDVTDELNAAMDDRPGQRQVPSYNYPESAPSATTTPSTPANSNATTAANSLPPSPENRAKVV
jgi:sec-independent protein translocase protein TatA